MAVGERHLGAMVKASLRVQESSTLCRAGGNEGKSSYCVQSATKLATVNLATQIALPAEVQRAKQWIALHTCSDMVCMAKKRSFVKTHHCRRAKTRPEIRVLGAKHLGAPAHANPIHSNNVQQDSLEAC